MKAETLMAMLGSSVKSFSARFVRDWNIFSYNIGWCNGSTTDSSGSVSLGSNPSPAAPQNMLFCRENAEITKPLENYLAPFDRDI